MKLTCTNGVLPESLRLGDISRPTDTTPERFTFRNIKPVVGSVEPPRSDALLWSVIGHTSVNILSLGDIVNLRSIVRHYNFQRTQDQATRIANERQIDGLLQLSCTRETRLVKGMVVQGQHIRLEVQESNWPSKGALYLWGTVLDRFLACYAGINSYTRFELEDPTTGTLFKWPMRLGTKPLL
jgi:type VI secretion system protein ImpG